jgi:hypothetical protein
MKRVGFTLYDGYAIACASGYTGGTAITRMKSAMAHNEIEGNVIAEVGERKRQLKEITYFIIQGRRIGSGLVHRRPDA